MRPSRIEKTATLLGQAGALTCALTILASLTLLAWVWNVEKAYLIGGALGALSVVLLPALLTRRYDVFQPLSFAILSVFIGVTGRTIYVTFSSGERATQVLLRGRPPEFLLPALLVILVGLGFFVLGYLQKLPRLPVGRFKIARYSTWSTRRLFMIVAVLTLLSLIASGMFLQKTGFTFGDLTDLSGKRFVALEEAESGYTALGYLRWMASLSQVAFLLIIAWFARSGKRWRSAAGLVAIGMFGLAALFPFLTSARGALLWLVISSVVVWHYARHRLSIRSVVIVAVVAVITLSLMISFRSGEANPWERLSLTSISERLFGSRDFLDVTTTASIIEALEGGRLDLSYGSTYFAWLYAPIPRTVWPDKPAVSAGWDIKRQVFGLGGAGGIPPGAMGEAFWAFGIGGVVVMMWLLGAIVGAIYRTLRPYLSINKNMLVIYAGVFLPWSLAVLGGGWSNALIGAIQKLILLTVALYFVTRRGRSGKEIAS